MSKREQQERTLQRLVSDLIPTLKDPRIPLIVTIERVRLTSDGSAAKVLVSTLEEDPERLDETVEVLNRASGFLQRELGSRLEARRTPKLSFTGHVSEVL